MYNIFIYFWSKAGLLEGFPCYMKDTYLREQIEKIIFVRQSNPIDLNSIMIKIWTERTLVG